MVAAEILEDIESLLNSISELGCQVVGSEYNENCFGNYVVDVSRGPDWLRIIRDRGQYLIEGDEMRLRSLGYWRALNQGELEHAVRSYLGRAV